MGGRIEFDRLSRTKPTRAASLPSPTPPEPPRAVIGFGVFDPFSRLYIPVLPSSERGSPSGAVRHRPLRAVGDRRDPAVAGGRGPSSTTSSSATRARASSTTGAGRQSATGAPVQALQYWRLYRQFTGASTGVAWRIGRGSGSPRWSTGGSPVPRQAGGGEQIDRVRASILSRTAALQALSASTHPFQRVPPIRIRIPPYPSEGAPPTRRRLVGTHRVRMPPPRAKGTPRTVRHHRLNRAVVGGRLDERRSRTSSTPTGR